MSAQQPKPDKDSPKAVRASLAAWSVSNDPAGDGCNGFDRIVKFTIPERNEGFTLVEIGDEKAWVATSSLQNAVAELA